MRAQDDPADTFFAIVSGSAVVVREEEKEDGSFEEVILAKVTPSPSPPSPLSSTLHTARGLQLGEGDVVGEQGMLKGEVRRGGVRATSKMMTMCASREAIHNALNVRLEDLLASKSNSNLTL